MDLTYTAAEEQFRSELRSWLQANIPEEWSRPGFWDGLDDDENFRIRRDWEREKAVAGFAGIQWPTEFGGRGGTPGMKAIYDVEMVLANAPRTVNPLGLTFLAPTVMAIGTQQQKKEIIGPLLRNEVIWCQGFSEPGAGSDLAALCTKGVRDGDDFVVNGQKVWTTNAVHGDKIFTLVRTEPDSAKHRGHLHAADRHAPAGRRRAAAQADERRQRVRRGLLHRRAGGRERLPGRDRRGLAHGDAAAVVRARRLRHRPVHRVPAPVRRRSSMSRASSGRPTTR